MNDLDVLKKTVIIQKKCQKKKKRFTTIWNQVNRKKQ